jgi:hypothetical protein
MDNPGRDLFNFGIKDVLGTRRQKEIQEVLTGLEKFRPTKIALEIPSASPTMQRRLDGYRSGKYALTPDERDQIGLRLANTMGLSRIHGIDFKEDLDFESVFQFAKENGQGELVQQLFADFTTKIKPKIDSGFIEKHSVREILLEANLPAILDLGHSMYVGLLRIGKGDKYPGTELVSRWYDRNLKIATNIARLAEGGRPERILVIIGSGHTRLLRQFLSEMPGFEVVDCKKFLQ